MKKWVIGMGLRALCTVALAYSFVYTCMVNEIFSSKHYSWVSSISFPNISYQHSYQHPRNGSFLTGFTCFSLIYWIIKIYNVLLKRKVNDGVYISCCVRFARLIFCIHLCISAWSTRAFLRNIIVEFLV